MKHVSIQERYRPADGDQHEADAACTVTDADGNDFSVHSAELSDERELLTRIEFEAARLDTIQAPSTQVCTDYELADGHATFVYPATQNPLISCMGELSLRQKLEVCIDVLHGLEAIHSQGLVQRCIAPEDVDVQFDAQTCHATLALKGPLFLAQLSQNLNCASRVALYCAPETLGAMKEEVGPWSDLYAFGVLMYELLLGQTPFVGDTVGDLIFQHMTTPVPLLHATDLPIPVALSRVIAQLLQKTPQDRYQSVIGVRHDLSLISASLESGNEIDIVLGRQDQRGCLKEPEFVGRSKELFVFKSSLHSVAEGGSRTLLVNAPSGLGKSRLLLEASSFAANSGFQVFKGQGVDQPGLPPLTTIRGMLDQTMQLVRSDSVIRERVRLAMKDFSRELHAFLPELVDEFALAVPEQASLSDRRLAFGIATYLGALGHTDQPVVVQIDDAQWADDITLVMLECWKSIESQYVQLVVASRPHDDILKRLRKAELTAAEIKLEQLNDSAIDELMASMAGVLPDSVRRSVGDLASGNPFVASAVLRGLVESGSLSTVEGEWQVDETQLDRLQMSGAAADLLARRLDTLDPKSQRLLGTGAVLGKQFSIHLASRLAGLTIDEAVELLKQPQRNQLVWDTAGGESCVFVHDQIRMTVMAKLTEQQQAEIHLKAAHDTVANNPDSVFDIARHFDAAGECGQARPYARIAAEHARSQHALVAAEQQYRIIQRSFAAADETPDFETLDGLGDILMLSGRYDDAESIFLEAMGVAAGPVAYAQAELKRGELAFKRDEKAKAIELWESALRRLGGRIPGNRIQIAMSAVREILVQGAHTIFQNRLTARFDREPKQSERLIWQLYSRLAHGYWYVSGKVPVLFAHLRGMNLAERYKATPELAQAYSEHAPAMTLIPWNSRGIGYGRRSLKIRTQMDDVWGQGQSRHFLAIALYSASKFEECIDVGRQGVRILEQAGDYWEKHIAQYQVAASLYRVGRFQEAVELCQEAYTSGRDVGDDQVCGNIIEVWARASKGAVPVEIMERELSLERSDVQCQSHVWLARGVQLANAGDHSRALHALNEGIRVAHDAGILNTYVSPLYAWKATVLRMQLEVDAPILQSNRKRILRAHRRASLRAWTIALRFRNELPHVLRELAWAAFFRDKKRKTFRLLRQSCSMAEQHGAQYELIQSKLVLARAEIEWGVEGAEHRHAESIKQLSAFNEQQVPKRRASASLIDRFDQILRSGREVASAVDYGAIEESTRQAGKRLLRSEYCEFIQLNTELQPLNVPLEMIPPIQSAIQTQGTLVSDRPLGDFESLIFSPVLVRGNIASVLCVASSKVRDLYGRDEIQIVNFISTLAGAAFENSDGFRNLRDLNANLEQIVEERTAAVEARSTQLQETADDLRATQTELASARDVAESANQAKTDFLAHMSHEIRTPIGAVLGFTELLLASDSPLSSDQSEYLQRVHSNGSHLNSLLNDLLDLSKIEAGELTVEKVECHPYSLLVDIAASLESKVISKGLAIKVHIDGMVPEVIQTDPTRLRQVVTNLVGNAIKFTEHGSVSLCLRADPEQQQISIAVTDTGVGIPESAQATVFEAFKQADDTVTRNFGGTGLGLSISRQLAVALGGDIELTSECGVGSTFNVTIDAGSLTDVRYIDAAASEQIRTAVTDNSLPAVSLKGYRILIADDVDANRQLFLRVLEKAGAKCSLAVDGREAVDMLSANPDSVDVVLMDMQMPRLDGFGAATELRSLGFTPPIIALTANGMDGDEDRCRNAGCSGYLTKPISMQDLLGGVASVLNI